MIKATYKLILITVFILTYSPIFGQSVQKNDITQKGIPILKPSFGIMGVPGPVGPGGGDENPNTECRYSVPPVRSFIGKGGTARISITKSYYKCSPPGISKVAPWLSLNTFRDSETTTSFNVVCSANKSSSSRSAVILIADKQLRIIQERYVPEIFTVTGGGRYCSGGSGVNIGLNGSEKLISYTLKRGSSSMKTMQGTGGALDFGKQVSSGTYTVVASIDGVSTLMGTTSISVLALPKQCAVSGGGSFKTCGNNYLQIKLESSWEGDLYTLKLDNQPIHGTTRAGRGRGYSWSNIGAGVYTVEARGQGTGCVMTMGRPVTIVEDPTPIKYNLKEEGSGSCNVAKKITLPQWERCVDYVLYRDGKSTGKSLKGEDFGEVLDFGSWSTPGVYTVIGTRSGLTTTATKSKTMGHPVTVRSISALNPGSVTGAKSICYNSSAGTLAIGIPASGGWGGYSYQWQSSSNNSTWSDVSKGTTCTPGKLTSSKYYRTQVYDGCNTKNTSSIKVTVRSPFSAGRISGTQTVEYGVARTLSNSASASGGSTNYSYQWESSSDNRAWNSISGKTSTTLSTGALVLSRYYRRKVTDKEGCGTLQTSSAKIVVKPVAGNITGGKTINMNADAGTISSTGGIQGGDGNYDLQWQISLNGYNWDDIIGEKNNSISPGNLSKTTYYRLKVSSDGNSAFTDKVEIKVIAPDLLVKDIIPSDENYIYTLSPQIECKDETLLGNLKVKKSNLSIQYFDGLGRAKQMVGVAASPNGMDVIQPRIYDDYGREAKSYLPFTASSVTGEFLSNARDEVNWVEHYGIEAPQAYALKKFDGSPLNRVVEQGAPGTAWQPKPGANDFSGHTVKIEYASNQDADKVILFQVVNDVLDAAGFYSKNQLYKTTTKDENWKISDGKLHTTEEFKDKQGQVILKRSYVEDGPDSGSEIDVLNTYYVYDDYGLLRFVLPPEAVNAYVTGESASEPDYSTVVIDRATSLSSPEAGVTKYVINKNASLTLTNNFSFKATSSSSLTLTALQQGASLFEEFYYTYKYDSRKRMIEKKLPGAAPVYMVYDKRDRLVATQDGSQRVDGKWLVTKYDAFNRPVMTAFYTPTGEIKLQEVMQAAVNEAYDATPTHILYESAGAALGTLYDNKSFPTIASSADVLTVNYYDAYPTGLCPVELYSNVKDYEHIALLDSPKGQLTASWGRVLNGDTNMPDGLWSVNFYDKKYRVVQAYKDNYLNGYDRVTSQYDFVGKVEKSKHEHAVGPKTIWEEKVFKYDHAGRLLTVSQEYTGDLTKAKTTIAEMVYDELGQLKTKKLTAAARDMDYQYNIRGWLTQMKAHKAGENTDEFGFALKYNSGSETFGGIDQFNGNIGAMEWWSHASGLSSQRQAYGYQYDALNRISNADFKTYSSAWKDDSGYDVTGITYDLNGNIKSLNRYESGTHIDQLAYGYRGNQLTYVNDGKSETLGFKELSNTTSEYTYDTNGNMLSDKNKGITNITYNLLNLPESISKGSKQIAYAYDATGVKHENRVSSSKKLQYLGNFVYENGSLKYILNEEGKLEVNDAQTTGTYKFFVKDHLGNTRLAVGEGASSAVTELNHYYPFGMRMGMANSKSDPDQKYLYNGKELQDETDWLDYGARMYDASIGRWQVMDNLSEKYAFTSPYAYAINNPIIFIDPDGNDVKYFFFQTGARGGLAKTAGYTSQSGYARDDYGITRFESRSYQKGDDNLKSGSNSAEPYVGFDIDLASAGFTSDSRSRSFEEHMNRLSPVSLNAAFVDVAIGDGMYSVELGLGFGGGFGNSSPDEITAISYTMKEAANLNNTFGPGQLSVNQIDKELDENGNLISNIGEIIHNGSDGSINRTGIKVWTTSNSDEIKQFWETLLYKHKKKEAK